MKAPIYLDYAATTPMDARAAAAMQPYLTTVFGNPSSLYSFGRQARSAVEKARRQTAALLHADAQEIFFTSGGSESDNWVLKSAAERLSSRGKHIITSAIEHHAILHTCQWLERQGFRITYLQPDHEGRVSPETLRQAIREDTVLISIMAANNEVGTLEPIEELGNIAKEQHILFHVDAVQAVGHVSLDMENMPIDALSLSGHKLYGPKGVGALYLRRGIRLEPLLHGGAQERGLRAGTENVPGIVGLGAAAELAAGELAAEAARLCGLRDALIEGILALPGAWLNGSRKARLPGNVSFGIEGISQEVLLLRLDMEGFAVSGGSACSAGSLEPSHVLLAMGQSRERAESAIRVSLGRYTAEQDTVAFLQTLRNITEEIRDVR